MAYWVLEMYLTIRADGLGQAEKMLPIPEDEWIYVGRCWRNLVVTWYRGSACIMVVLSRGLLSWALAWCW